MSVSEDYDPVDEVLEVEVESVNVGNRYQQRLPRDVVRDHNLYGTIINVVVSQGDTSFVASGVKVDSEGQFCVPKQKAKLHGLDRDGRMTVFIESVEARR
jgi:hypothetical protein